MVQKKESMIQLTTQARETLGKLRIEAGFSYREVEDLFKNKGISIVHSNVSDWEHKDRGITPRNLDVLLSLYSGKSGVDIDEKLYPLIGVISPRVAEAISRKPELNTAILLLDKEPALCRTVLRHGKDRGGRKR